MEKNTSNPSKYGKTKISDENFGGFPTKTLISPSHDGTTGTGSEAIYSEYTGICLAMGYGFSLNKISIVPSNTGDPYAKRLLIKHQADVLFTLPVAVPEVLISTNITTSNAHCGLDAYDENGLYSGHLNISSGEKTTRVNFPGKKIKLILVKPSDGELYINRMEFP